MYNNQFNALYLGLLLLFAPNCFSVEVETQMLTEEQLGLLTEESDDRLELKTSVIKGNKELPQVLYIVPWQSIKKVEKTPENLVLHSLYGDIFTPVTPEEIERK